MKREPHPYAQQRTYTVTQTMAISVPSVVAEDVLDGEDGGMNAVDNSALQELQSDMVELKSDVATLETNVNNLTQTTIPSVRSDVGTLETKVSTLIYDTVPSISADVATLETDVSNLIYSTIPTINTVVAETRAQANLASQKSQVTWLTTPDYTTSKLQITSGSGLKALQLTTKGQTATIHDLVVSAAKSSSSSESALTLSGFAGTYKDYNSTVLDYKLGLDFDFDTKQAYLIVKNGADANWQPYQLESGSSGASDVTVTEYLKKLDFKGDWTDKVIAIRGNFNGETGLYYYALAASAFANVEHPECQLKVSDTGLLYTTTDGGNVWTVVGSSDSTSENYVKFSDENNALKEVVVRRVGDSFAFMARTPDQSSLAYYSLAAPSFYCGNGREFEFRIVDAGSNVPGLQMRRGSSGWVTITGDNNSSSGSTSNTVIFGPFGASDQYELSLALNAGRSDAYSAVVELRDTTNSYSGAAALGAYLAAPTDNNYYSGVLMAVSGMGTLVFKFNDETVTYDLSKLNASNQETLAAEFTDTTQSKARLLINGNNRTMQLYSGTLNNSTTSLARYGLISELAGADDPTYRLRMSPDGIQTSSDSGGTWTTLSGGGDGSGAANKLTGYIADNSNELITDLDYQLCLGKDSSDLPYILVSNNEGISWTPLQISVSSSDRQRLDTIDATVSTPFFSGSSQNTYKLIGGSTNTGHHVEFSSTIVDQLDTSAGAISLSNMVWLSANASNLAALLNS